MSFLWTKGGWGTHTLCSECGRECVSDELLLVAEESVGGSEQ